MTANKIQTFPHKVNFKERNLLCCEGTCTREDAVTMWRVGGYPPAGWSGPVGPKQMRPVTVHEFAHNKVNVSENHIVVVYRCMTCAHKRQFGLRNLMILSDGKKVEVV